MAVTKIWPIKDSVKRVVDYIKNPEKTEFGDMKNALHYIANSEKVSTENEVTVYVTGVNCRRDTAFEEMKAIQKRFGKTTGNVAYHAYQSFKRGEVSPEMCHKIGVQLAEKMWGDDYQVLVATHFNTGTYHNHFVVNAVGLWDGKKFNCNKKAYWKFRSLSDELCRENNLYVIKNPVGQTPRKIYFAEKNNEPTKFNLMREAIDFAIKTAYRRDDFFKILRDQGYEINERGKYPTIKSLNSKKATRLWRLGESYELPAIFERMKEIGGFERYDANKEYKDARKAQGSVKFRTYKLKGSFKTMRKSTGIHALYLHYCFLLGKLPKKTGRKPMSPEMKEAWRYIDKISEEVNLIGRESLESSSDIASFKDKTLSEMEVIKGERNKIYNKLRRCSDPVEIENLKEKRDNCTQALRNLRKDLKVAERITAREPAIKEEIKIEENMQRDLRSLDKTRKRGFVREEIR